MRLIKTLGLAATAALAAMAFVSAGTATADTLCLEHKEECGLAATHPIGTVIHAETGKIGDSRALLLTSVGNVHCYSLLQSKTTANLGPHKGLQGLIEVLTFKECESNNCGRINGDTAENLPYKFVALGLNVNNQYNGEGTLHVEGHKGGSDEAFSLLLLNCFSFYNCLWGTKSVLPTVLLHKPVEGALALKSTTIHVLAELLRVTSGGHSGSGFCPATTQFHALYNVTKPTGLIGISPKP